MSECCSGAAASFPRKQTCPENQRDYIQVPLKTVLHHIKHSWQAKLKEQGYYFCTDPHCDIVYFAEDGSAIKKSDLRTKIVAKEDDENALVCHCFGVTLKDAKNDMTIKNFVIEQTKIGNCSCETSNPSGRCCLKDFPS
ncbi:MAG: hypothetical protein OEW97_05255 [Gammaproteobacteria bacterium]|nr:hypothetical protein [Gammaproteobacteria bacterium]